ncbi:MAG: hypothetical protein N2445_02660 [Acidobacteria bacterium]|nr:hypothetical protein [Acidobacteriota bacterium]
MNRKHLPLWVTIDSAEPNEILENFINDVHPYGIILFSRHLKNVNQVKELISFVKNIDSGILFGIDQEGGRVSRLSSLGFRFEGAIDMHENPDAVRKTSSEMAEILRELGFDVNFAPVVDIGDISEGTGLEGRIYSKDNKMVVECASAFLEGLKENNIKGCLKHFPGLGGSKVDSHKDLPYIIGDSEEREYHLYPYKNLKADFVMVAHASYQFFSSPLPSSINEESYSLLKKLNCCDKIVTDDLSMGALKNFGTLEELTRKSLKCGSDIAMVICSEAKARGIASVIRGDYFEER